MSHIRSVRAQEVLDSRGFPTVEVDVALEDRTEERAIVPSGASTGSCEAVEMRDGDSRRFGGKGVLSAVANVNDVIGPALVGKDPGDQRQIDTALIHLDGTPNKARLGANAIVGVSIACARAAAASAGVPLYRHLATGGEPLMPVPCLSVLNGGRHADNNVDFQEFMIAPLGAPTFAEAVRFGSETFHELKSILQRKGYSTAVGDEGGFAPALHSASEAVELILTAIEQAGFKPGVDIALALDPAASEFYDGSRYVFSKSDGSVKTSEDMIRLWEQWTREYPIVLLEDGLAEDDWEGWRMLTESLGKRIELVGDDIFCTNVEILKRGISEGVANSILIKLSQIGTVTEAMDTARTANDSGLWHDGLASVG